MAAAKAAAFTAQPRRVPVGRRWPERGLILLGLFPVAAGVVTGDSRSSEFVHYSSSSALQLRGRSRPAPQEDPNHLARGIDNPLLVPPGLESSDAEKILEQELNAGKQPRDVAGDLARAIWGSSKWPPANESLWPPDSSDMSAGAEIRQKSLAGYVEMLSIALAVLCFVVAVFLGSREAAAVSAATAKAAGDASAAGEAAAAPGAGGGLRGGLVQEPGFVSHFSALACASCWRHLHRRALAMHLLRFLLPLLSLALMYYMRDVLVIEFAKPEWQALLHGIGVTAPEHAVDAISEYVLTVMLLYLALAALSNFTWHLAMESETGFRRLLHVSGLSRTAYLMATVGVDGVMQTVLGLGIMALIAQTVLRIRLVVWTSPALLLLIFIVLALSTAVLGYLIHFPFSTARSANMAAQLLVMLITFTAPFSPLNHTVPLRETGGQNWKSLLMPTVPAYDSLFELARACAKGRCLVLSDIAVAWTEKEWVYPSDMTFGVRQAVNPTPPAAIISLFGLVALQLALGWALAACLDARRLPALRKAAQKPLMQEGTEGQLSVLEVSGLVHCYGWLPAAAGALPGAQDRVLGGISFSASAGATLGLLGPNGAGKTTAIRCITGEEAPTAGSVCVRPAAVGGGVDGGTARIGLCPQETVLNEDLTVSENILLFARVRGFYGELASNSVAQILIATRLQDKRDWMPGTLSGGMRRRLCVACAMVGSPAVAILDEPTTGLDPLSRRGIWGTIGEIKAAGGCCLLTTHMLEEAEALCTNLVILRKGTVAAEGSVQQLKEEWGTGYVLNVDANPGDEEQARSFVAALLPEGCGEPAKVSCQGQLTFKVPGDAQMVGRLFIKLAEVAEANGIRRWGISQASLEDAYLRIIQEEVTSAA